MPTCSYMTDSQHCMSFHVAPGLQIRESGLVTSTLSHPRHYPLRQAQLRIPFYFLFTSEGGKGKQPVCCEY
eukprot:1157096-Pelagomonas_calceolata.AAC.5